ncbi:MAG: hypothetical protein V1822_02150 [Candidatus Micrarchaeota archaeon]
MNITIEKRAENAELAREEINFRMDFDSAVPSREQAKSALSTAISIPKERIILVSIRTKYGLKSAWAQARVYKTAELAAKGKNYLLVRDKMVEKKAKAEKKKAAPAPKKE